MKQQDELSATVYALSKELSELRASAVPPDADALRGRVPWGKSDIERRISQVAASAVKAYNASPAGQALRASLSGKSLDDVRRAAAKVLSSPELVPVRRLVEEHARAPETERSMEIRAISLGLEFSLFIAVAGVEGSVGVAVPPHDWDNFEEYVVYVTASALVGEGANEFGGVTLGLWTVQPTDLAGTSWGAQINLGDFFGGMIEVSFVGEDFIGVSVATGEDGGVSVEFALSDTWVFGWDEPHVYQPPAANYMIVQSIVCEETGEVGNDEIYFKFTPDGGTTYRYPTHGRYSLDKGQSWDAGRSIYFNSSVLVELFDNDDGNDDPRGSVTYTATNFPYNTTVSANGGRYQINAVLNPTFPSWPPGVRINTVDQTNSGPGACTYKGKLYYFWKASNNGDRLYFSASSDGATWPAGAPINSVDYSPEGPTAIELGGELFVFWRGGNNGVYWSSSADGQAPWPNGLRIGTTNAAPAPCVFGDELYLFWNDTSTSTLRIVFSVFDPVSRAWSAAQSINGIDNSADRLAPCVFQDKLYVFWRIKGGSNEGRIFYSRSSTGAGSSWPSGASINNDEYTKIGPAVNVYQGNLFVFFVTNDSYGNLVWTASATGTSWPANTPVGAGYLQGPPVAVTYDNSQCLCWTNNSWMWFSPSKS